MDFDIGMMHAPVYTAIVASILMIMTIVLMSLAIRARGKYEVMIGAGGEEKMEQAIRVHGNLIENAPIFVIGLGLAETLAGSNLAIAILGGVFVVSRIAHAVGFGMSTGVTPGRFLGTVGTMLCTVGTGGYLFYLALDAL